MKLVNAFLTLSTLILSCSSSSQMDPHAGKMIIPGRGTNEVQVGMSRERVINLMGKAGTILEESRWLSYQDEYFLAFRFDDLDHVSEIHFCEGFKGHLPSRIQPGSKTLDVFQAYGSPVQRREIATDSEAAEDRVLYTSPQGYRITYRRLGLAFWFSPLKRVTRIIVFQPLPDRGIRIKPVEVSE